MNLRKTEEQDLKVVMEIIKEAQEYLKKNNVDQWQDGYPTIQRFKEDIEKENSYVLVDDEQIVGTAYIAFEEEQDYNKIYKGSWLTLNDYAVIHRIAISNKARGGGAASKIMEEVERMCTERGIKSIKIDTHRDNLTMQNYLKKTGFKYCGIIYLIDGSERFAYEKLL